MPLVCQLVVTLTPPPLVLLTRPPRLLTRNLCLLMPRRLLSTGASPPFCIGFADWLSRRLSPCRLCFASPILALPPHVSFLSPPPCVCIGWLLCRILTRRLCLPSPCPRGRFLMASASCHACDSASRSNLVRPNWFSCCLLWHLLLTSTSLPSLAPQSSLPPLSMPRPRRRSTQRKAPAAEADSGRRVGVKRSSLHLQLSCRRHCA